MTSCPKCGELTKISQPAEPDVGIMGDMFECKEHGEFYINGNNKPEFVDELAEVPGKQSKLYSTEEVLLILKNVGIDTSCGACAETAFTGSTGHVHTCGDV